MALTRFEPEVHGFHFPNAFDDSILVSNGPVQTQLGFRGRCNGMAWAALDYFFADVPIPTHLASDFAPASVPPNDSALSQFILMRQYMSAFNLSASNFIWLALASDEEAFNFTNGELEKLQAALAAGNPAAIGLVNASGLTQLANASSHTVVVHGSVGDTLLIYDSNHPDSDRTLTRDGRGWRLGAELFRGWFVFDYTPMIPGYRDLVIDAGISCALTVYPGRPFRCSFVAKNIGQFTAHLKGWRLGISGPAGEPLVGMLVGDESGTTLAAGASHPITKTTDSFDGPLGKYTFTAGYFNVASGVSGSPGAVFRKLPRHGFWTQNPVVIHEAAPPQPPPPAPYRHMTAKIDPYPVPLKTLVPVRVTATDDATGQAIVGADVFLNDLPMGKTPADFTRRFDPRVVVIPGGDPSDPEIELAYPRLAVRESTYFDAEVDCGWPE